MKQRVEIGLLTVSTAAALLAAAATVLVLDPEDRISKSRGIVLTWLGGVFYTSLFKLINDIALTTRMGGRFRHQYSLNTADVMDISNKLVSLVQALLCSWSGIVVCSYSCSRDMLNTSHYMSEAYAWFGAAYFFYDIWSMYEVFVQRTSRRGGGPPGGDAPSAPSFLTYCLREPLILAHHVFIGAFGFLTIVYFRKNLGDCVFGFAYLMEVSTPFVSVRGILSKLKLKETNAYVINGLLMLFTFFLFRVASMPYVQYMYSQSINMGYLESIDTLPRGCKISICILLIPQVYWFLLMSKGAVKVFLGPSTTATKKSSTVTADKLSKSS